MVRTFSKGGSTSIGSWFDTGKSMQVWCQTRRSGDKFFGHALARLLRFIRFLMSGENAVTKRQLHKKVP
jgi:hypothetical protein